MTQQNNQQTQTTTRYAEPGMTPDQKSMMDKILDNTVVYQPFMADSEIKLSARIILSYFAKPTRRGCMPTPQQAARFVMLCKARALNPWEGDAFIVGYDTQEGPEFNLITAHQAFLKRAEVHPEYDGMESGVTVKLASGETKDLEGDLVDDGQVLLGGWARVHFKNRKIPTYRRLKLSTFTTGRSRWQKDPAGMIAKCAEADALRSSFPTKLGGMYLREEFDAMAHEAVKKEAVPMPRAVGEEPAPAPIVEYQPQADPEPEQQEAPAEPVKEDQPVEEVAVPQYVIAWREKLEKDPNLEQFNAFVAELPTDKDERQAVWKMLIDHGKRFGVKWDKKAGKFFMAEPPAG